MKTAKKRVLSFLLVLAMVLTILPGAVLADDTEPASTASGTCGDNLTWTVDADNTLTISGTGAMTDYDDLTLFPWPMTIQRVVIEKGVTTIGASAFEGYSNITSVSIPNTVTEIHDAAFMYCNNLMTVTVPSGVTSIGDCTFCGCCGLTSISVPETASIGIQVFKDCIGLADAEGCIIVNNILYSYFGSEPDVVIPSGVTEIANYAFTAGETGVDVTSVTIPESVIMVRMEAFSGYDLDTVPAVNWMRSLAGWSGTIEGGIFIDADTTYDYGCPDDVTDTTNGGLTLAHFIRNHYPTSEIESYDYAMINYYIDSDGTYQDYYFSAIMLDEENQMVVFSEYIDLDNDDKSDAVVTMALDYTTNTIADGYIYVTNDEAHSYVAYAEAPIDAATFDADTMLDFTMEPTENYYYSAYFCNYYKVDLNEWYNAAVQIAFEDWEYMFGGIGLTYKHLGFEKYDTIGSEFAGPEHQWDDGTVVQAATCQEHGVKIHHCTLAGCTATRTEILPRAAHTWDSGTVTDAMTDTEDGVITYTCTTCGATRNTFLPAGGSPYVDVQDAARYYFKPVLWANAQSITNGYPDSTFRPNNNCTRGNIVTFLYRADQAGVMKTGE